MSKVSEHEEQSTVIQWAAWHQNRYPQLKWLHSTPNGAKLPYRKTRSGKRFSSEAVKLKAEGLKSGVADLFLPVPVDNMGGTGLHFCGLWIEMKAGDNKPTEEQLEFLYDMNAAGYLAMTAWGSDYAITCIATYLGIPVEDWW
jgi:hypothetical protein